MASVGSKSFDAIVIGSGQGGTPLCLTLAGAGMRTAIVEREHVGGTCINEGCTPTKTMVASARVAYLARRGVDYGVHTGELRIDRARVRERKRAIVESFRSGSQSRIEKTKNLELIFGEAEFTGPKTIVVGKKDGGQLMLTGDRIFINAGCRPAAPKIEGLVEVAYLNSTSIMELDSVPEHLLVLGGGYIGLEFGQMFRRFGSRVTIVQSGAQLLAGEDVDVAGMSNADSLNVKAAGIATDKKGFVQVNDRLETNVAGIFAIGDIKGGPAFTHISYDDFRIIRSNVIEKGSASIAGRLLPYTVFIDPQLGRIGMTETEARSTGRKVRVAKMPMSYVARALEVDESRGFIKVIVDADSSQMLGAAVLGVEGGEIMSQIQLAMMGKLSYTVLKDAVFAHPTLAESLNNLFSHFDNE